MTDSKCTLINQDSVHVTVRCGKSSIYDIALKNKGFISKKLYEAEVGLIKKATKDSLKIQYKKRMKFIGRWKE